MQMAKRIPHFLVFDIIQKKEGDNIKEHQGKICSAGKHSSIARAQFA